MTQVHANLKAVYSPILELISYKFEDIEPELSKGKTVIESKYVFEI